MTHFHITPGVPSLSLPPSREGQVSFTVSNNLGRPIRIQASIRPEGEREAKWLSISGEAERELGATETATFFVQVQVPRNVPAGGCRFSLLVASVEKPDDEYDTSSQVAVTIPKALPPPPFPWRIAIAAAGVVLIVAGGGYLIGLVFPPHAPMERCDPAKGYCCAEHPCSPAPVPAPGERPDLGLGGLVRWGSDPAAWSFSSGTQGTIAAKPGDALEGDSAFDFTVIAGTTGAVYTYGDFIAVDPRQSLSGRISAKLVSGAGPFSAGVLAYDTAKKPLGSRYFIAAAEKLTQASWSSFSGIISGEGAARTALPPGTRFIKPAIFVNEGNIGSTRVDAFSISPDETSPCFGVLQDAAATWGNDAKDTAQHTLISRTFSVSRKVQVVVEATGHMRNEGASATFGQLYMDGQMGWKGNEDIGSAAGSIHYYSQSIWTQVTTRAVFIVAPGEHTVSLRWSHGDYQGTGGVSHWNGILMTTQFAGCVK